MWPCAGSEKHEPKTYALMNLNICKSKRGKEGEESYAYSKV